MTHHAAIPIWVQNRDHVTTSGYTRDISTTRPYLQTAVPVLVILLLNPCRSVLAAGAPSALNNVDLATGITYIQQSSNVGPSRTGTTISAMPDKHAARVHTQALSQAKQHVVLQRWLLDQLKAPQTSISNRLDILRFSVQMHRELIREPSIGIPNVQLSCALSLLQTAAFLSIMNLDTNMAGLDACRIMTTNNAISIARVGDALRNEGIFAQSVTVNSLEDLVTNTITNEAGEVTTPQNRLRGLLSGPATTTNGLGVARSVTSDMDTRNVEHVVADLVLAHHFVAVCKVAAEVTLRQAQGQTNTSLTISDVGKIITQGLTPPEMSVLRLQARKEESTFQRNANVLLEKEQLIHDGGKRILFVLDSLLRTPP